MDNDSHTQVNYVKSKKYDRSQHQQQALTNKSDINSKQQTIDQQDNNHSINNVNLNTQEMLYNIGSILMSIGGNSYDNKNNNSCFVFYCVFACIYVF